MVKKLDLNKPATPTAPNTSSARTPRLRLPGISAIEVLIIITIIAILAAVAVPVFLSIQRQATQPNITQTGTGTSSNPYRGTLTWFNTDEGAVQCLTSGGGGRTSPTYSCNWQTLERGNTRTGAQTFTGKWVTTAAGTTYCITTKAYSGQDNFECDWVHVKSAANTSH